MSWSQVAIAAIEKSTAGAVGLSMFIALLALYGITVGVLRIIQRMYVARQIRKAVENINSKELVELLEDLNIEEIT